MTDDPTGYALPVGSYEDARAMVGHRTDVRCGHAEVNEAMVRTSARWSATRTPATGTATTPHATRPPLTAGRGLPRCRSPRFRGQLHTIGDRPPAIGIHFQFNALTTKPAAWQQLQSLSVRNLLDEQCDSDRSLIRR